MSLRETYNRIADDWFRDHAEDTWWIEGTDHFLSLLSPGATILDVGCGAGVKSKHLADKGFKVTGIDFSDKMIDIAKRELPNIDFKVWDLYELEKLPEAFDAVFAQASLLHVPKARVAEAFKQFKSKVKPGGFLYVAVKEVKADRLEEKTVKESDYGYEYERFFSFFSLSELKKYFEDAGFSVVWENVATSGRANWIQVVGKRN